MTRDFTKTTLTYPQGADNPIKRVMVNRAPLTSDYKNFISGDEWLDTSTSTWWKFIKVTANVATWVQLSAGTATLTFNADSGSALPSAGIVVLAGTSAQGVHTSASGNTITTTVSNATTASKGVASFNPLHFGVSSGQVSLLTPLSSTYGGTGINNAGRTIDLSGGALADILTRDVSGNASWSDLSNLGVSSATGTSNRITVSPTTGDVVVDISASYVGQASITTLGTISTGTWNGTVLSSTYGGTGINNAGLTINLSGGATGDVLTSDASGNATWATLSSLGVTSVTGTSNRITASPTTGNVVVDISASYVGQASITTLGTISTGTWNGTTIDVPHGGTGVSTTTAYGVICGGTTSTGNFQNGGTGTSGQLFISNGSSSLPSFKNFSITIQIITASGTYTPTAGMQYCIIELVGGGGGGAGSATTTSTQTSAGGGGGGGGYTRGRFSAATVGVSQAVTIGAGGAGGIGNNVGSPGGSTSVGALLSAGGGGGGTSGGGGAVSANGGGAPGTAGTGTFATAGGGGGGGFGVSTGSGVGGVLPGFGGESFFGGGAEPQATTSTGAVNGNTATNYGAGGSGAGSSVSAGAGGTGGSGASGAVLITEYVFS